MNADDERRRLKRAWPDEWRDGYYCGFSRKFDGEREAGGYPLGFHQWPLARRNAWCAGVNLGRCDRLASRAEGRR